MIGLILFATQGLAAGPSVPEHPAFRQNVVPIHEGKFSEPYYPAVRTSADGRIGLNLKTVNGSLQFVLLRPESLVSRFSNSGPGARISAPFAQPVPVSRLFSDGAGVLSRSHFGLCDPRASQSTDRNPYACGPSGTHDCYELVVIRAFSRVPGTAATSMQLQSTQLRIQVADPKTARAQIVSIQPGATRAGGTFFWKEFHEPMVTTDGHLLVARLGSSELSWETSARQGQGEYDIVYAYSRGEPCGVGGWSKFKPISIAPFDPDLRPYGIAAFPFRDAQGNLIPPGSDLKVSYPWIDRRGSNLFFTAAGPTLYYWDPSDRRVKTRYPTRCLLPEQCEEPTTRGDLPRHEQQGPTRVFGVMGGWTQGKMVLLDGALNNLDYGMQVPDAAHRLLKLYQPSSGPTQQESAWVRAGSSRDASSQLANAPEGYVFNTTFLDSPENLFNHDARMRPPSHRDVTWLLTAGKVSTWVDFDDLLDPDALIISEMVASSRFSFGPVPRMLDYQDGFRASGPAEGAGFQATVHLQNSATAPNEAWIVPASGQARGPVRIEPVASGGIHGKGLWLEAGSRVDYVFARQTRDIDAVPLYASLFIDPRFNNDGVNRKLLEFPDGSSLSLVGLSAVRLGGSASSVQKTFFLPSKIRLQKYRWSHLAIQIEPHSKSIALFVDGYLLGSWSPPLPTALFRLRPGNMVLGGAFRGWIDEFKLIASDQGPERACNHARGTLAALSSQSDPEWAEIAAAYPASSHETLGRRLVSLPTTRFVCFHRYEAASRVSPESLPPGLYSVRKPLTFAEGPLRFGSPRPDSSRNPFCQSCHTAIGWAPLGPGALAPVPGLPMEADSRRQPLQPPALIFGNVPANYAGPGKPFQRILAPVEGIKLDEWTATP